MRVYGVTTKWNSKLQSSTSSIHTITAGELSAWVHSAAFCTGVVIRRFRFGGSVWTSSEDRFIGVVCGSLAYKMYIDINT